MKKIGRLFIALFLSILGIFFPFVRKRSWFRRILKPILEKRGDFSSSILSLFNMKGEETPQYPYELSQWLLTKAELSFYRALLLAVGERWTIFSKVRVADVLRTKKGLDPAWRTRSFNAISSKHFDFLLCDPVNCSILLALELDDSSHESEKRQKRDLFINSACEAAGLPLLRVKVAYGYSLPKLLSQIEESALPLSNASAKSSRSPSQKPLYPLKKRDQRSGESATKSEMDEWTELRAKLRANRAAAKERREESASVPHPEKPLETPSPFCPQCGAPMVRRTVKSGKHAGRQFWCCSTFPDCRSMLKIDALKNAD